MKDIETTSSDGYFCTITASNWVGGPRGGRPGGQAFGMTYIYYKFEETGWLRSDYRSIKETEAFISKNQKAVCIARENRLR